MVMMMMVVCEGAELFRESVKLVNDGTAHSCHPSARCDGGPLGARHLGGGVLRPRRHVDAAHAGLLATVATAVGGRGRLMDNG